MDNLTKNEDAPVDDVDGDEKDKEENVVPIVTPLPPLQREASDF